MIAEVDNSRQSGGSVHIFSRTIKLCLATLAITLACSVPALAVPILSPTAPSLEFGSSEVHYGSNPTQAVTFFNVSSSSETVVKALSIVGPNAADFSVSSDGCSGQTLQTGQSCEVQVRFQPQTPGEKSARLQLGESFGTVEVTLLGMGVTGTLSASPLSFPTTVDGQNREEQINIDNVTAGTHISQVEITGPDASSFQVVWGNCVENTLAQNNSCDVGVRFEPTSPGPKTAQLLVTSDASNAPFSVALSGAGAAGPRLSLSPRQALLGDVPIGTSASQVFTATNTGDYPLGIQQTFMVSGTPLMFPIASDTCSGRYIEPGASCSITVDFQPATAGPKDASIIFITESQTGVIAVGLEGSGVPSSTGVSSSALSVPHNASSNSVAVSSAPTLTPTLSAELSSAPTLSPGVPELHPRLVPLASYRSAVSVSTGVGAVCPAGVSLCRVQTILTTNLLYRSRDARDRGVQTPVLLGSTTTSLRGGQSTAVNARLSPSGLALLARRHKLKVSLVVAIAAPGVPTVMHWRTFTLVASLSALPGS